MCKFSNRCIFSVNMCKMNRRAEYTVGNVETTTALFRANTSYMVVPASLLVIVTSYIIFKHHLYKYEKNTWFTNPIVFLSSSAMYLHCLSLPDDRRLTAIGCQNGYLRLSVVSCKADCKYMYNIIPYISTQIILWSHYKLVQLLPVASCLPFCAMSHHIRLQGKLVRYTWKGKCGFYALKVVYTTYWKCMCWEWPSYEVGLNRAYKHILLICPFLVRLHVSLGN